MNFGGAVRRIFEAAISQQLEKTPAQFSRRLYTECDNPLYLTALDFVKEMLP